MGGGAGAGGGRAARALRVLLLVVLALAAVEYLFGSILDASPLRTYLYTPAHNASLPALRINDKVPDTWPKKQIATSTAEDPVENTVPSNTTIKVHNTTKVNTTSLKLAHNSSNINISNNVTVNVRNNSSQNSSKEVSKVDVTSSLLLTKIQNVTKNVTNTTAVESKIEQNSIKTVVTENEESEVNESLPLCDEMPPDLGPITKLVKETHEKSFPEVGLGGHYKPPNCTARHRVAIIVPYRDREEHLIIFVNHMHAFLMKQQIEYGIFIVEQFGNTQFNRAKLMNVGFVESQKLHPHVWQCFVFHDIDLLPLDERNLYSCPRQPRHMSAAIDKLNFKLPYEDIFGGVSAMTKEQFTKVNGFSNQYWGWGGEDDDMFHRLRKMNYHIARYKMSIARYAMLHHKKSSPNPKRYQLLSQTNKVFLKDGLSTLDYILLEVNKHALYTRLLADIDERS